uniref:Ig-like domain-containing protein n=1 Tax=Leptobrachium leishanense TaxID=445787 RepID=A0A8C5PXX0_9ANUR
MEAALDALAAEVDCKALQAWLAEDSEDEDGLVSQSTKSSVCCCCLRRRPAPVRKDKRAPAEDAPRPPRPGAQPPDTGAACLLICVWERLPVLFVLSDMTSCCLSCIHETEEKFRELKAFLNEQHEDVVEFHAMKVQAVKLYNHLLSGLESQHADKYSMEQMEMEFKKTVDMIEHSEQKGFCPNLKGDMKCGMMDQTVTHCGSCKQQNNFCVGGSERCREILSRCPLCLCDPKGKCHDMRNGRSCTPCEGHRECLSESLNCGTRHLVVEEREDIVFDCTLDWHHKLENTLEYVYEKIWNKGAKVMSTTDASTLEKKFSSKSDAGEYRCTARLLNKVPVSTLTYNVKIIPSRIKIYKTRPTLPPEETTPTVKPTGLTMEEKVTYGSIILVAVSGFLLLIFAVSLYMYRRRQNQDQVKQQKRIISEEEMVQMPD